MSGSERNTCVHTKCDIEDRRRRIRELNDGLRRYARAGIICITAGVQALGEAGVEAVLTAVRDFDCFTADNDPYEEHDFGAMKVAGNRLLWKIDYYDHDRRYGSADPADPAVTTRVLTIMLATEY
jgi:hypothetical protein